MANIHDVNESLQVQPSVRNLPTLIALSQGENGRSLQFRMVGATIPSGSSASLSGTKPDGVVYSKAGTVNGNTVIFQEDVQLTAVAGAWDAKIHIVNSGNSVATALIRFIIDPDPVAAGAVPSDTQLEGIVAECKLYAEAAKSNAYGSPLTASAAADMIDTAKVYVYTGSETGYTAGHWYYYNGTAWADGGVYNSIAIQTDTTLTLPNHAADAKATGDALATKADKIGNIALAERLYGGEYSAESEPYHFRQAPEGMGAKAETIVGGSLGWNQLVENGNFESATGWYAGLTTPTVSNNIASYTATSDGTMSLSLRHSATVVADHKVLSIADVWCDSNNEYRIRYPFVSSKTSTTANTWTAIEKIGIVGSGETQFGVQSNSINGASYKCRKVMLIDLTTCFGTTIANYIYSLETANAGAGVAWVKRYINLDTYHEYCEPTLKSVEGLQSRDVVGFNQWDEEWELGYYSTSTGEKASSVNCIRCKNKIPIIPGATYFHNLTNSYLRRQNWDADGNFISQQSVATYREFTVPDNAYYITFYLDDAYGTTYNHDICINLSDPSRNGTYEPYEKHSYPLDSSLTLRGVPKLVTDHIEFDGDKYHADGSVERRYGVVDLGTLIWVKTTGNSSNTRYFSNSINAVVKKAASNSVVGNILCAMFSTAPANTGYGGSAGLCVTLDVNGAISVYSENYTDAATFKTAMSGVMLVYELATPTTETAQPFQSPMIVGATEEYVSDSVVPVGHESKYYEDVAKKVSGLPKDFSTLIAPTEATYTATRNYTVGSYLIVKNQLYKVTSAISSGGTITPNSNVTATTIMAEILALA